jgi:predicted AAA+ superfamily ATPase
MDTGLVSFLLNFHNHESLRDSYNSGHIFETYCVSEIIKSYTNYGISPPIYYYRDYKQNEIDVLININGKIHPIEIKQKTNPTKSDIKGFKALDLIGGIKVGTGYVICSTNDISLISKDVFKFPISQI